MSARAVDARTLFWVFLVVHVAIWTLAPLLVARNLPLDVVEALAWGREWQLGYHKHPPLSAWLAEIAFRFGREWPLFLLPQIMVAVAMWAAWQMANDLLPPWPATFSVMAMAGIHYHSVSSLEFNANVAQYPFWAVSTLAFWRAVRAGATGWWLLLGLAGGLGFLAKYSFLFLPAAMAVFLILHPAGRTALGRPGPYLALGAFVLIALPHLLWGVAHDFPAIAHAAARGEAAAGRSFGGRLTSFVRFTGAQALAVAPMLLIIVSLGHPHIRKERPSCDDWLLITLGLGPLLGFVTAAALLGVGLQSMWGAPLFVMAGPMALYFLAPAGLQQDALRQRRFAMVFGAVVGLSVAGYLVAASVGPQITGRFARIHFPGRELANAISDIWRQRTQRPLASVVGDFWLAGNVAAYSDDRPSLYTAMHPAWTPWLSDAEIARSGAMVVWLAGREGARPLPLAESPLAKLRERFPSVQEKQPLIVVARWLGGSAPVHVNWAIIPPSDLGEMHGRSPREVRAGY